MRLLPLSPNSLESLPPLGMPGLLFTLQQQTDLVSKHMCHVMAGASCFQISLHARTWPAVILELMLHPSRSKKSYAHGSLPVQELNVDTVRMPLGQLKQEQLVRGYEVLERLSQALSGHSEQAKLEDLSSEFYQAGQPAANASDPGVLVHRS